MDNCRNNLIFLSESSSGNIIKCMCCNCFQISFNNLMISFKEKEFNAFKKNLDSFLNVESDLVTHHGKNILIRSTDIENLTFAFEKDEFLELLELMNEANYMNTVHETVNEVVSNNLK